MYQVVVYLLVLGVCLLWSLLTLFRKSHAEDWLADYPKYKYCAGAGCRPTKVTLEKVEVP